MNFHVTVASLIAHIANQGILNNQIVLGLLGSLGFREICIFSGSGLDSEHMLSDTLNPCVN